MSARLLHGDRSDRPARHTGRRANPSAWRTFFRGTSTLITRIISWSLTAPRFSRRMRIRSVTNGPPGTSQRHGWHERPGHGEHVPPAIGAGGPVPRLRDVLRRRHRAVSRLWQPDVGLGCSLSCQEPRDKPPVSCTSRSDGATDRPAVGTRRLFGGNSTPTGACLCWRLRALKRPWPSSLTIRPTTLPSRRRNKRRR